MSQSYRNARQGFLTDMLVDTTPIGSIVPNLKSTANSFDHNYVKSGDINYGNLSEKTGNAYITGDDPAYTHEGYLYCDGSEYQISDYPVLYSIIGNQYGGRSSQGIDLINSGAGYTSTPTVTIGAPAAGGIQATASAQYDNTGKITTITTLIAGEGYDPYNPPTVTISGGGGSGATAEVRIDSDTGGISRITTANVLDWWGVTNLGTFAVPDTKARKIVGNNSVFGNNSPNIGNSSLGVGITGGQWYFAKESQDEYFSLGRITTSGYDAVVETTGCTIIGSQDVTVTMKDSKLPGVFQHSHSVFHSVPGQTQWVREGSGDRYLQDYKEGRGRVQRWYPTTGQVFTHKHGLLRRPNDDNTVATYDAFDAYGGAGGAGTLKDDTAAGPDQAYLASGAQGAGSWEFQTFIPNPISYTLSSNSVVGGRNIVTGGTPIINYTNVWEFTNPGSYSIDFSTVTGSPESLQYIVVGGGGSGANGNTAGNNGTASSLKIGDGSGVHLVADGGEKGGAASGQSGGSGGDKGGTQKLGLKGGGKFNGLDGTDGQNGVTNKGFPKVDYPSNPNGGGIGGLLGWTPYGVGTNGVNKEVTGQSGTYSQTKTSNGSFSGLNGIAGILTAKFTLSGGAGGNANNSRSGHRGVQISAEIKSNGLSNFTQQGWSVSIGGKGSNGGSSPGSGGSNSNGASGKSGGTGDGNKGGAGGGGATLLYRGSQLVIGAGGGGGAGADGNDGGPGQNGISPVGLQQGSQALGPGSGGKGGNYGCIGGGGGGGGGGAARNGFTTPGGSGGGAPGGPGGAPGGNGGHQGGGGGMTGTSSLRNDYFTAAQQSQGSSGNGYASLNITYNNDYWTPGGGGGGGSGVWNGVTGWDALGNPASAAITVGSGGSSPGGGVANGGTGYVKVGLGVVTGWEGGTTTVSIGDVFESGSADADDWDVNVYDFGDGSGVTGNFKKPTETPIIKIIGGGGTGATATCTTSANGTVNNVTLTSGGSGYTEQPYAYVLNGSSAGTIIAAQVDQNAGIVSDLTLIPNSSSQIESFLKFGGVNGKTSKTRFAVVKPTDCTQVNYISIKAARGNDSNGGNKPEETLKVYYQLNGSETWNLIDTIINPNASRTDPLIGTVPSINSTWDGTGGNTKWYTYSVALPSSAKQDGVKIKFEQQRANANSANDNADNTDHYGISEVIYWKEKVTELIFVPTAGAISKPAVDSLTYTIQGQTGPGITYSSGLNASDATLTMKSTTKVEPIVSLDPDFNIPLLVPYRLCKYLIKAF